MTVKGGTSQACAACKYQRRKCSKECSLAPYFPANNPKMFQNAHRLFGVSNIGKILKRLDTQEQKDEAMKSVIYESEMRDKFPVHGCCGIIGHYYAQLVHSIQELQYVHAQLSMYREECHNHNHNQIVDHSFPPSSELQLGTNPIGNELMMLQHQFQNHQLGGNALPFEGNHFGMSDNNNSNSVYVESNDDLGKQLWMQHPNYNNSNDLVAINQSQYIPSQPFPVQLETEVDYDGIPFDTMADDRQSYIESKEACESSCQSSWKEPTEHVSQNELKSAAAGFSLTSVDNY